MRPAGYTLAQVAAHRLQHNPYTCWRMSERERAGCWSWPRRHARSRCLRDFNSSLARVRVPIANIATPTVPARTRHDPAPHASTRVGSVCRTREEEEAAAARCGYDLRTSLPVRGCPRTGRRSGRVFEVKGIGQRCRIKEASPIIAGLDELVAADGVDGTSAAPHSFGKEPSLLRLPQAAAAAAAAAAQLTRSLPPPPEAPLDSGVHGCGRAVALGPQTRAASRCNQIRIGAKRRLGVGSTRRSRGSWHSDGLKRLAFPTLRNEEANAIQKVAPDALGNACSSKGAERREK
ncbi:unnamed protein product [Lampetra fluviatilis]